MMLGVLHVSRVCGYSVVPRGVVIPCVRGTCRQVRHLGAPQRATPVPGVGGFFEESFNLIRP